MSWDSFGTNAILAFNIIRAKSREILVIRGGLEPPTYCLEGISHGSNLKFVSDCFGWFSLEKRAFTVSLKSPDKSGIFRQKFNPSGTNLGQRFRALTSPNQINGKTITATSPKHNTFIDLEKKKALLNLVKFGMGVAHV